MEGSQQLLPEFNNISLDNGGSLEAQKTAEQAKKAKDIDKLGKMINATLSIKLEGYLFTCDIASDVFEDTGIDPYKEVIRLGFGSFDEFLASEHMKKYMEIDTTDGIPTYHAITRPEDLQHLQQIHQEQRLSFLDLEKRRRIRLRQQQSSMPSSQQQQGGGFGQDNIAPEAFLRNRMFEREARRSATGRSQSIPVKKQSRIEGRLLQLTERDDEEIGDKDDVDDPLEHIKWRVDIMGEQDPLVFCSENFGGGKKATADERRRQQAEDKGAAADLLPEQAKGKGGGKAYQKQQDDSSEDEGDVVMRMYQAEKGTRPRK